MLPKVSIVENQGVKYMLFDSKDFNTSDFITHMVRVTGQYELNLVELAERLIDNQSGVVLDIGANFGTFAVPLAKRNAQLAVMAFEPQRIIFNQLCGNSFLNELDNLYTYNLAVGEVEDTLIVETPDYNKEINIGAFSFDPLVQEKCPTTKNEQQIVNLIPLDSLELDNVLLIKIDVEGMELAVLKGASETIKRCGYPPILFESWGQWDWWEERKQQLMQFIESLDYVIVNIQENNFLAYHKSREKLSG